MKTVVIGCGNIGVKRINAIQSISEIEIAALVEVNLQQKQLESVEDIKAKYQKDFYKGNKENTFY